jgi:hypothetical protein
VCGRIRRPSMPAVMQLQAAEEIASEAMLVGLETPNKEFWEAQGERHKVSARKAKLIASGKNVLRLKAFVAWNDRRAERRTALDVFRPC